jgi:prepilin-type processing-associated H-X9-DG protein
LDNEAGPMFTNSKINERQVSDGLSNTICNGEKWITELVVEGTEIPAGTEHAYRGDSSIFSGDSEKTVLRHSDFAFPSGAPEAVDNTRFGSEHNQICNFAFLDGSVRSIPYSIERHVLEYLCVMADGQLTPSSF